MTRAVRSPRGPARFGALVVLSGCFVVSAFLRVGDVVAALPEGADDGFGNPIAEQSDLTSDEAETADAAGPESPGVLVAELDRQREALKEREARIAEREQTLETLEQKLTERLAEIRAARDRLSETAALVDDAAGEDVRRLARMYQQMKPKQAGLIFNEMAPSFAAGFMAEMRPDAAALIMASMDAHKAYAVSLLLAGRNVEVEPRRPGE